MDEETRAVIVTNHLKVAEHALQFDNLSVIMLGGEMIRITNCSSGSVARADSEIPARYGISRSGRHRDGRQAV